MSDKKLTQRATLFALIDMIFTQWANANIKTRVDLVYLLPKTAVEEGLRKLIMAGGGTTRDWEKNRRRIVRAKNLVADGMRRVPTHVLYSTVVNILISALTTGDYGLKQGTYEAALINELNKGIEAFASQYPDVDGLEQDAAYKLIKYLDKV